MAHVKVIRRSLLPDEWTRIRIGWLKKRLIAKRVEITGWTVREGRQTGENSYKMYDSTPRPLNRGDEYFTPDGTAFLHAEAKIPPEMRGERNLRLMLTTAGEMLVRVNGRLQGGIDPNRETLLLPPSADGRYVFDIEGYNRSKPDDDRNEDTMRYKGCRQVFQGGWFVVEDESAAALYHDVSLFYDIIRGGEFDEDYTALVSDRLYHALSIVDRDPVAGINEAREYIAKELYGNTLYRGSGVVALVAHRLGSELGRGTCGRLFFSRLWVVDIGKQRCINLMFHFLCIGGGSRYGDTCGQYWFADGNWTGRSLAQLSDNQVFLGAFAIVALGH